LLVHCHHEAFHAQWEAILDDEFLEAYEHGIVIECCDGVKRRFYLRIFTYSADYTEKYIQSVVVRLTCSSDLLQSTYSADSQLWKLPMSMVPHSHVPPA
jgi:hypothetical protein